MEPRRVANRDSDELIMESETLSDSTFSASSGDGKMANQIARGDGPAHEPQAAVCWRLSPSSGVAKQQRSQTGVFSPHLIQPE